jgi:hypothetical protein
MILSFVTPGYPRLMSSCLGSENGGGICEVASPCLVETKNATASSENPVCYTDGGAQFLDLHEFVVLPKEVSSMVESHLSLEQGKWRKFLKGVCSIAGRATDGPVNYWLDGKMFYCSPDVRRGGMISNGTVNCYHYYNYTEKFEDPMTRIPTQAAYKMQPCDKRTRKKN